MQYIERYITSFDATRVFVRNYRSPHSNGERTLLIIHGLGEHGGRYEHVARLMIDRGWQVIVADLRGHGRSDGIRTHVDRFRHFTYDVVQLMDELDLHPLSTALLGHSLGGLITIRLIQRFPDRACAAVVTSPLLRLAVAIPGTTLLMGKVCSLVAPRTRFRSRVDPSDTTRSAEVLQQRLLDPFIERSITAGGFFALRRAIRKAWQQTARIRIPLMIVQAGDDRIVDPLAAGEWLDRLRRPDRVLEVLDEHFHEVLNEPDCEDILDSICNWLDTRIPGAGMVVAR